MNAISGIYSSLKTQSGKSNSGISGSQSSFFAPVIQPKLTIGSPDDVYEQEADRMADKVMRMTDTSPQSVLFHTGGMILRKCDACEEEEKHIHKKGTSDMAGESAPGIVHEVINSGNGHRLDTSTESFMENRFKHNFSNVHVHTNTKAAESAAAIQAKAYTTGDHVIFNSGEYSPHTDAGKRLLAHELAHVVQQGGVQKKIQRAMCEPYTTPEEAASTKWWLRNTYMRAEGLETFGTEVYNLYDSYLNRKQGDSLSPRVFDNDSSYIHNSFKDSGAVEDDMDLVLDLIGNRLSRAPGGSLRDGQSSTMSLSNFLTPDEMNNRPINFSNPLSVSGHIAGGEGSSDAGNDYRKITYANVRLTKNTIIGSTGYTSIELFPHYEVFDAIDFCPGDSGSPLEATVTVPMSRLEASNEAYDMPFKVVFSPDSRSKRVWF